MLKPVQDCPSSILGRLAASGTRFALLLLVGASFALGSAAQDAIESDESGLTPNFKDVDIRNVVEAISQVTNQNFLLDARVKGNVTLISEAPMTEEELYETFLSILQVYGYVAVPSGNITKIIPDTNARQVPGPSGIGGYRLDDIVTEVLQVQNVGAAQLVPILRPLVPQYGHLAAHPASNMLIIADRSANVRRLKSIIRCIDQSSDEDIEVLPMQHASATEIVRILSTLNQANARGGGDASIAPLTLVADERTNSVLISGDRNQRLRFRTLVAHLDTPIQEGGNTQVIYLNYADAEELATKLSEQVRGTAGAAAGGQTAASPQGQSSVIIWSDAGTNSLVITAPPEVMRSLRNVIDKIDIRRAQVHVEAILVEVLGNNNADLGVTWILDGRDKGPAVGFTNFGTGAGAVQYAGALLGGDTVDASAVGGLVGSGLTLGAGRFRDSGTNFGAIINALQTGGETNILSTPSIVTMDNEEAEVNIGEEVPFLTGSFSNTGGNTGAVNPFQTIQRQDVGIKLKITPQINEGSAVIMDIELEASSVSETGSAVDLITNQRQFNQRVIVDDGGVIVLGGLIDDLLTEGESAVPVLSKIPVLGALFRSRNTTVRKRNLMVFIRPKILRDGTQATIETGSKYRYIRDLQLGQSDDVQLMPNMPRPVLPTLEQFQERGYAAPEEAPR